MVKECKDNIIDIHQKDFNLKLEIVSDSVVFFLAVIFN